MFELLAVAGIGLLSVRRLSTILSKNEGYSSRTVERLERLWKMAQVAMRESKYIPAEKALLTILKIDHKNAPAYNRLGILYAKQKNYDDAIECFEIASSIDRKPSSLHNLGLIYYETEQYEKAAASFEKAIGSEPMAVRYIALAKALRMMEHFDDMIAALEKAYELEPNPQTVKLLVEGFRIAGRGDEARSLQRKLKAGEAAEAAKASIRRHKQVV
jgi:tetratricopeptide (TPR) repeat protein